MFAARASITIRITRKKHVRKPNHWITREASKHLRHMRNGLFKRITLPAPRGVIRLDMQLTNMKHEPMNRVQRGVTKPNTVI